LFPVPDDGSITTVWLRSEFKMLFYHIAAEAECKAIMSEGFNPPVQEGSAWAARLPSVALGQNREDRVSFAVGGRLALPWVFMKTQMTEGALAVLECKAQDWRAAFSFPVLASWTGELETYPEKLTVEVTAPREKVIVKRIIRLEEMLSMRTDMRIVAAAVGGTADDVRMSWRARKELSLLGGTQNLLKGAEKMEEMWENIPSFAKAPLRAVLAKDIRRMKEATTKVPLEKMQWEWVMATLGKCEEVLKNLK